MVNNNNDNNNSLLNNDGERISVYPRGSPHLDPEAQLWKFRATHRPYDIFDYQTPSYLVQKCL